jgi:hypothetical protein
MAFFGSARITFEAITTVSATSSCHSSGVSLPSRAASNAVSRSLFSLGISTWHSGSPKAAIILHQLGALLGDHQAQIEHAQIGHAARAMADTVGLINFSIATCSNAADKTGAGE